MLKLKDLINIIGGIAVEVQHSMGESSEEKFKTLFEDPDGDGTFTPKMNRIQIADGKFVDVPVITRRVLHSIFPKKVKFKLETPLHIAGDTGSVDDIEVSLKKGSLFKSSSSLSVEIEIDAEEPAEGMSLLLENLNSKLHRDLVDPQTAQKGNDDG